VFVWRDVYIGTDPNKALEEKIGTQRQAEEALRKSEERYRALLQNNHSVMLLIDLQDARILDANPAAISYYGTCVLNIIRPACPVAEEVGTKIDRKALLAK